MSLKDDSGLSVENMNLEDRIRVEISVGSLASLIAGWYFMNTSIDMNAIPSEVFIELSKRLVPFLDDWDYTNLTIEDWIKEKLVIAPMILFDDIEELKNSDIYFEYPNGNVILIIYGEVVT